MSAPEVRFPKDVAPLRTWLLEQWRPDKTYAQAMQLAYGQRDPDSRPYYASEIEALRGATLWWVSADMVDLLLATAVSVPDDMMYSDLAVPSNSGLIILEKTWIGTDAKADGVAVRVEALTWSHNLIKPIERGNIQSLTISAYHHIDFAQGMDKLEMQQTMALGAMGHGTPHYLGRGKPPYGASYNLTGHTWLPLGRSNWPLHDRIDFRPWQQEDHTYHSFVEDRKVLAALFTLLRQQGIARTEIIHVDRPTRRQAERAGVSKTNTGTVQVVTLRKLEHHERNGEGEPKKVDWTHRWMVDGYFRWQRVGKGLTERRLTFVSPHIKGPEDRPFEPPTRVNAWRR